MRSLTSRVVVTFVALVVVGLAGRAVAAPEGTLTYGVHVTVPSRW